MFYSYNVFSQTNIQHFDQDSSFFIKYIWDLNKYVWSHSHFSKNKSEKPPLDFDALDNWINLSDYLSISPNGSYFAYGVQKCVNRYLKRLDSIIVQSSDNSWKISFHNIFPGFFSGDNMLYVFKAGDSLGFLKVGTNKCQYIDSVSSYKLPVEKKHTWIAYKLNNDVLVVHNMLNGKERRFDNVDKFDFDNSSNYLIAWSNLDSKELIIYNLSLDKELRFDGVKEYLIDENGRTLVLKTENEVNGRINTSLQFINLPNGSLFTIWSTEDSAMSVKYYSLDGSGKQVIFMLNKLLPESSKMSNRLLGEYADNSIWYWKEGMINAGVLINEKTKGINADFFIQELPQCKFSDNGRYILFNLQFKRKYFETVNDRALVDVWNYKDTTLQAAQLDNCQRPGGFKAVLNLESRIVVRLENEFERMKLLKCDYAIISKIGREEYGDRFWEKDYLKDSN